MSRNFILEDGNNAVAETGDNLVFEDIPQGINTNTSITIISSIVLLLQTSTVNVIESLFK